MAGELNLHTGSEGNQAHQAHVQDDGTLLQALKCLLC